MFIEVRQRTGRPAILNLMQIVGIEADERGVFIYVAGLDDPYYIHEPYAALADRIESLAPGLHAGWRSPV